MDNNNSHDNELKQKSELEEKEVQNEEEEIGEHDIVIEEDFQINMEIAEISNPQPLNAVSYTHLRKRQNNFSTIILQDCLARMYKF